MRKLDRDMLGGVLDLRDLTVSDIMVHRTNMDAIDADLPPEQIVDAALKSSHTRLPLWRGEREEIIGAGASEIDRSDRDFPVRGSLHEAKAGIDHQ